MYEGGSSVIRKLKDGIFLDDFFLQFASINDVDEIASIEKDSHPSPWSKQSFCEIINRKSRYVFLLLVKNFNQQKIIAYICFQFLNNELYLLNVTVEKNFRRRGVAKKVLDFLIEIFKNEGCERVVLDVQPQNIQAVGLYKKLGFSFANPTKEEKSKVMYLKLN